ncbi:hypothetical protein [Parasphingopyxis marina]|uniref:Fimbrial protein n=1 Tax=Parasphingopyxis marina TaxID=2761622 RepID=A0A842I0M0_9SPHN|nr:hypothetical protein [Parasphingopyxis marina]MBC2778762.1 hypothetical protein [Parasphingopyxis marina]
MKTIKLVAVAAFSALLPTGAAMASPEASGGFGVSVTIPVVCDLDASAFVLDETQNLISGYVQEYCNSSRGFQVMASHRPLEAGEAVEVSYGGDVSLLDPAGISAVAFRAGPRLKAVPVSIQANGLEQQIAVSFAVTAI